MAPTNDDVNDLTKSAERPTAGHTVVQQPESGTLGELNPTIETEDTADDAEGVDDDGEEEHSPDVRMRRKVGYGLYHPLVTENISFEDFSKALKDACGYDAYELTPEVLKLIVIGDWPQISLRYMAMFDEALTLIYDRRRQEDNVEKAISTLQRNIDRVERSAFKITRDEETAVQMHRAFLVRLTDWTNQTADLAQKNHKPSDNPTEDALHGVAYAAAVCDVLAGLRAFMSLEGEAFGVTDTPTAGPPAETDG